MRSAWNWSLSHAHATRVTLLVVLIVSGSLWGWFLWKNGGYTENAPPTPQFMEVYVDGNSASATASVVSVVTPVTSSGKACALEDTGCDDATEYVKVLVNPQRQNMPVHWVLVTNTRPVDLGHGWVKAPVTESSEAKVIGFPSAGVWVHQGTASVSDPTNTSVFKTQFHLHLVSRPADHLVVEMPDLLNESDPRSSCGAAAGLLQQAGPPYIIPAVAGNTFCSVAPGGTNFYVGSIVPGFTGPPPISYYAPAAAASTEYLYDSAGLRGFTLDSADGATPNATGFDWTGSYQLQPAIYATNISSSGLIARRQLLLGILIGLVLAALLGLVGEFRHEKGERRRPVTSASASDGDSVSE
jgi:hypothetical protein